MRRAIAVIALAGTASFLPAVAFAQTTPTEPDDVVTVADDDDDDSDKTGLWGLLGLLGLAGLAGLKRNRDDSYQSPPTPRNTAPPSAGGATGTRP